MKTFATDLERLSFLLEAEAELQLPVDSLEVDGSTFDAENQTAAAAKESDSQDAATDKPADRPKYITNYIGSKQKLVDWIWKHTPDSVGSVLDAFSGSAVVAYMYKSKGLQVTTNDRLHFCHHAAKAIIENSSVTLSEEEMDALAADNAKAGTFVRDNFKGIFFASGVHAVIDTIRANCDKLSGYKKDLALFALGKSCASGGFGHFSSSAEGGQRKDTPEQFKARFRKNLERINALVFDNGKANTANHGDVNTILPKVNADLAYFDPPYATEFSTTNYEKAYHFVEGLMVYWKGLEINKDSKTKHYATDHQTVTKGNASSFFETFLGNAKHIKHWLISYRDHAYPNESEMKKIIAEHGRTSRMQSKDHSYSITAKRGEASSAKERLFVCEKSASAKASEEKPQPMAAAANFHTSFPVDLSLNAADLRSEAMMGAAGDPQFTFILCRAGTNRNGDHFTPEELSQRHMTAINKKVDLQHSQEFGDIVGGIVAADYLEDENGGRVECVGELYAADTPNAQLAYKLMKRGIITQVSMECDYEEGECSICHKRFKSKADYCTHLRKFKGRELSGTPVYEILHGVTFSGLGLLDRKGADEQARILQVASVTPSDEKQPQGDPTMDDKDKKPDPSSSDAAKKKSEQPGGDPAPGAELEKENRELKAKVAELQKKIEELEAEQKAAAAKARASQLIGKLEKQGMDFGDDRDSELKRLAELSDDAFAATEAAYAKMAKTHVPEPPPEKEPVKKKAKASEDSPTRTTAGVRPHDVDDHKLSLEDRLKNGFMAAYNNRVGNEAATEQ